MSWSELSKVLDFALELPRALRSNAIDHGRLRLLFRIAHLKSVGRAELERHEQDDLPAINKRLVYHQPYDLIKHNEQKRATHIEDDFHSPKKA